jgi:hypothetical protein
MIPIYIWHHQVQENQVKAIGPDHLQGLAAILGGGNLVALALQAAAEHVPAGLIIIYNQ